MEELLGSLWPLSWLKLFLGYKLELVFQVFSVSPKRDSFPLLYILSIIDKAIIALKDAK
jgi:hypothetical protein